MPNTTTDLVRELVGTTCRCGRSKIEKRTFCATCYWSLPKDVRKRLYSRIGEGYEEAYAEAAELLDASPKTRIETQTSFGFVAPRRRA